MSFQHFESALGFYIHFQEGAKLADGERDAEIMYTDSFKEKDGVYNLTWGEGDKAELAAVGADNACF